MASTMSLVSFKPLSCRCFGLENATAALHSNAHQIQTTFIMEANIMNPGQTAPFGTV